MDHRQGNALQSPHLARLAAQSRPVGPRDQEQRRRRRQRDECQLPIEEQRHIHHPGQGHRRAHQRDEPFDHDGADRRGVLLDPVHRVGGTDRVVVGERESLEVAEDPRAEVELELLPGEHGQILLRRDLELVRQGDQDGEACHHAEQARKGGRHHRRGQHGAQYCGQGARAEHAVHGDLERQRAEQRERARQQADEEQHGDVTPPRARLQREPPIELQVALATCRRRSVTSHAPPPPTSSRNSHANPVLSARKARKRGALVDKRLTTFS